MTSDDHPMRAWFLPMLAIVALAQSVALFKMVYDRDRLLKSGREIAIATQPVDPRDFFRGDYVTLGYDIATYRSSDTASMPDLPNFRVGSIVYATISPAAAGAWTITNISAGYPEKVSATDIVLRGRIRTLWRDESKSTSVVGLSYGIESYFVPEGTGQGIADAVRAHKVEALVAVDGSGTAALKGLIINGERHVDPPLL